jgi:actin-like ATPase involved in cell morphogenesis
MGPDAELGVLSAEEARLLGEHVELQASEKRRILAVIRAIEAGEIAQLFRMSAQPSQRELKRAYFELSKLYHPDRFYGRKLGSFGPMLARIFATLSQYVKTLGDSRTVIGETSQPAGPRRRHHERHVFSVRVALRASSRGTVEQLETVDVGSGGLFLASDHPPPAGDEVELRILVPGAGPISLRGRVAHVRPPADAHTRRRAAGMGVEIAATGEAEARIMRHLVALAREGMPAPGPGPTEPAPTPTRVRFARGTQSAAVTSSIIAIDLGTSYTSVSAAIGSRVSVLPWPDGARAIPSVVACPQRGRWLVGARARDRLVTDPRHVVPAVKRLLGRQADDPELASHMAQAPYGLSPGPDGNLVVEMWNEQYAVPQLLGLLLGGARDAAERALGVEIREAVVTVPVSFTAERVALLRRAGRLAGLDIVEVIEEPSAAALACRHTEGFGGLIGVYDFGGGTFDFSVVDVSGGDFHVLTTAGDSWLGGDDLDYAVAEAVANQFWKVHGVDLRQRLVEWQHLLGAVEKAKRDLSLTDTVDLVVPEVMHTRTGPRDLRVHVSRERVEPLWVPPIARSIDTCVQALASIGVRPQQLSAIYLSGGTSYVPAVRRALAARFGVPVKIGAPPEHAVCLGAGIHAAQLSRRMQPTLPAR